MQDTRTRNNHHRNPRPDGRQHRHQADSTDESRLGLPGLLGLTLALGLLAVGGVSYLDRVTAPTRMPLAASASGVHQHLTTPAPTLLGPLLASTPEVNVRLEARASTDTSAAEPGIPSGQKIMLDFQITDAHTGQPLAGLSPTASLESAVPIPTNPFGPADTGDPFDARDTFVLVNGAGDLGILESDGASAHRHQPGSSLTSLTGSTFAAVVKLPGPSAEAVADRAGRYIFASIPDRDQVAVVDTLSRRLVHTVDVGKEPFHLGVEPGGKRVWVANDGDGTVTSIDAETHTARTIPVGAGHHEFAFGPDSRLVFVTSSESGTVSALDAEQGRLVADARAGRAPHGIDFADGRVFIADEAAGAIVVLSVDGDRLIPVGTLPAGEGTTQVRIHPFTHVGVASNRGADSLTVFDATTLEVRRTVAAGRGPDAIAFVEDHAIVRNSLSPDVTFVNLTHPEVADEVQTGSAPVLDAPHPGVHARLSLNAAGDEVLVPSPAEGLVYQLHVMMGRPMVMTQTRVDRGSEVVLAPASEVHELSPGTYQRIVRFGLAGRHTLTVRPAEGYAPVTFDLDVVSPTPRRPWVVTSVAPETPYVAGREAQVRFQVIETGAAAPDDALPDPVITVYRFGPGQAPWQQVLPAVHTPGGIYQAAITFPGGGSFSATLSSLSAGLSPGDVPPTTLDVAET